MFERAVLHVGEPDAPIQELEDRLGFLLRCASNAFDAQYMKFAADLALTPSQMAVLLVLNTKGRHGAPARSFQDLPSVTAAQICS